MSSTIDCPKCGQHHDPDPEIQDMATQCCDECGFEFDVYVDFQPVYSTQCTEHEYGDWGQHLKGQVIVCRVCDICGLVEHQKEEIE